MILSQYCRNSKIVFKYDKNHEVPVHYSLQHIKKSEQTHNSNTRLAARCNYLIPKKGHNMEKNFH